VSPSQRARLLCQVNRGADVRWQVAQVAGKVHALADRNAAFERRASCFRFPQLAEDQTLEILALSARLALEAVEAIGNFKRGHCGLHCHPLRVAILDHYFAGVKAGFAETAVGHRADCAAHAVAKLLRGGGVLRAEPDEKHAPAGHAGQIVEHQGRTGLRVEIALLEKARNSALAGTIDRLRGGRELRRREYGDGDTVGLQFFRCCGFYAKFHCGLLIMLFFIQLLRIIPSTPSKSQSST